MQAMTHAIKVSLLVLCVLGAAYLTFYITMYMAAEERIKTYCQGSKIGETIAEASQRAKERNLTATNSPARLYVLRIKRNGVDHFEERESEPHLYVVDSWASNHCLLLHDGHRVTEIGYDPWTS
jgi:hypothetical protein